MTAPTELEGASVGSRLSPACRRVVMGAWPRNSWTMHHAHIRFLNRHRMIEQANPTDYRLTAFGSSVVLALRASEQSK